MCVQRQCTGQYFTDPVSADARSKQTFLRKGAFRIVEVSKQN